MEARLMKILPSPDNKFALTNLVFVNPYDFNPYLIIFLLMTDMHYQ